MTTEVTAFDRNDESLTISESIVQPPCSFGNVIGSLWQYVNCCWHSVFFKDPSSNSDPAPPVQLTSVRREDPIDFDKNQPLSLISLRRFGDEFRSPDVLTSENIDGSREDVDNSWILRKNELPHSFLANTTKTTTSSVDEDDFSLVFEGDYVNFQMKNTDYDWIFDEAVFGRVSLDGASSVHTTRDVDALDNLSGRSRVWAVSLRRRPSETLPDTARSSGYSSRLTDVDNTSAATSFSFAMANYFDNEAFIGCENPASDALNPSSTSQNEDFPTHSNYGTAFVIHSKGCGDKNLSASISAFPENEIRGSRELESIDRKSSDITRTNSLSTLTDQEFWNPESAAKFDEANQAHSSLKATTLIKVQSEDSTSTETIKQAINNDSHDALRRGSSINSNSLIARRRKSRQDELHIVLKKLGDHSERTHPTPLISPALSSPSEIYLPHEQFFGNFSSEFEPQSPTTPIVGKSDKNQEMFRKPADIVHSLSEPIPSEAQGQSSPSTCGTTFLTTSIALPCPPAEPTRSLSLPLSEMKAPGILLIENSESEGDTAIFEAGVPHVLMDTETVFLNGLQSQPLRRFSEGAVGRTSASRRAVQRSNQVDEERKVRRHLSASQRRTLLWRRVSAMSQVTSLLLEGQTRKLVALQWELESSAAAPSTQGSIKAKEQLRRQLITSIERVQSQFDQLEREYTHQALGRLRNSGKSNRSQPAIGLKQTHKNRPTIFGTVAGDQCPKESTKRGLPQTPKGGGQRGSHGGQDAAATPEWATLPDDDNSLVYEDGVLVSGSLQALVQHATPTSSYYPDTAYLFAFLLSSRLFIKPHDLLQRVSDLGFTQQGLQNDDTSPVDKDKLEKFVVHIVQLLGEWSETFPYDFRDERVMSCVRTITHRCIALQPNLRRDVTQILHNLLNKLTHLERYEESLSKHTVAPPADSLSDVPDITEICSSPLVMAQQLTHIELERLSFIGPEEFVQAFAKDSNIDSSYKDLKKTNNLEVYVQWFNKLSYLVATQAVSHLKKKQRVRVIEWWIEVARECFNIGNFNSLMGIIAGLNMSPVSRLKKTWSKVQTAKFSVLEHQMDPTSNFSSYRSTLKAAMWRSAGAVDDRQKIVIPFFSLLVKDLYFLNEGCANRLPNGYINFDKFWQLAKQVTEFMAWKQVSCPFERVPHVINYLQSASILSEIGLAHASFECEGPENSYEKERYKNLHRVESQPPS